jgi:Uma2 family endonuclease
MATNPKPQAPWGEYAPHVGPMTVEQFEKLPSQDGWTYELYHGRLIRMPGPGGGHGDIQAELLGLLRTYLKTHKLGVATGTACYVLQLPHSKETVLCPDISYSLPARKAAAPKRGTSYLVLTPDLVAEIISPNDARSDIKQKTDTYLDAGVRLVWNVWPNSKQVEVWRPTQRKHPIAILSEMDTLDGLDVIPGFACLVRDIFP